MCAFHLMQPRLFAYMHSIRVVVFIANERTKKNLHISHSIVFYIDSDWKIEHSNSCNSKSIWAMQSLPPPPSTPTLLLLLRFLFCFYHLYCRSACFFHDCIIRKMLCCSHTKRIPNRCSFYPVLFCFFTFSNLKT